MERKENEHQIKSLKELSTSDFKIKDGQPDIILSIAANSAEQAALVCDLPDPGH